jgi:hypothetical protein
MELNCIRAKHHTVDFMAIDASAVYLATGCGADVRIWKGGKHHHKRMPSMPSQFPFSTLLICMHSR